MSASILKNSLPLAVFVNDKDQATECSLVKNTNEGLVTKEELKKLNAI